jgi:hypothetical protein
MVVAFNHIFSFFEMEVDLTIFSPSREIGIGFVYQVARC